MTATAARARESRERRMMHYGTAATLTHLPSSVAEAVRVSPIRSVERGNPDGTRVMIGHERFELLPAVRGAQLQAPVAVGDHLRVGADGYRVEPGTKPERVNGVVTGWRVEAKEA